MTLNDLEIYKLGVLVNFSQFHSATHICRVNFCRNHWINGDKPRQPAYENRLKLSSVSWALAQH